MSSRTHQLDRRPSRWRRSSSALAALTLFVGLLAIGSPAPAAPTTQSPHAGEGPALQVNGEDRAQLPGGTELAAEIRRTEYGIPHIKADDWASLGFGYGYAFAEDNLCLLAEEVITGNGQRSEYFGANESNFRQDLFHQQLIDQRVAEETINRPPGIAASGPSLRVRDLVQGTAEGYNEYLASIGGAAGISDPKCSGAPWVRDITEIDLWRTYIDSAVRAGRGALATNVVDAQPPGVEGRSADRPTLDEVADVDYDAAGSNAYGLGSEATQSGGGMLLGNPHFPWDGRDRFYEMHLTIPGEYDMIGAALSGQPIVEIGHNETMGWSHTVSTARRFTFFELQLVPGQPTKYLVDGQVKSMTSQQVDVEVDDGSGGTTTRSRTLWSTEYGPIVEVSPLDWTDTTAYALMDVNEDAGRTFDGYLEMGQSGSVAELEDTLDTWQHLPWINTVAADSTGKAFYGDHSVVPNVDQAKLDSCLTPIGVLGLEALNVFILDGARSGCRWGSDPDARVPGIFGPSNLPTLTRDDYVTNSNDSYWLSNPEEPLEGFNRIIGVEGTARSLRTRLGIRQVQQRIDGTDGLPGTDFDLDLLQDVMFSNRVYGAELVRDDLVDLCRSSGPVTVDGTAVDLSEACDVLEAWDMRVNLDSEGAHLFREFASRGGIRFSVPYDVNDPVNTPNTLDTSDPDVLVALAGAVKLFNDNGIALDAPLGTIQSEPRNDEVIPIHGGTGSAGAFNIVSPRFNGADGYNDIRAGASIILAAEFTPSGPKSRAVLAYSNSTDPTSPHYADQTRLYSEKGMVDLDYHEADILADPELEVTSIQNVVDASAEERFVAAAYQDFLDRAPTAEELRTAVSRVQDGVTGRRGVVASLARSPEWATTIVDDLYTSTLGRPGDPAGTAFWADAISSGRFTVARVAARFYASAEYLSRFPAGDFGAWIDDLYTEILGRPSDPAGRAYWIGIAESEGPTAVALRIYQSSESARTRVNALYLALLGRSADGPGLAFWTPRVLSKGDITLAIDLASSSEYLARAQRPR